MTMKSVLLGAAAGIATISVAQAADLPMTKAEAVEYVKVCSEFGPGFLYPRYRYLPAHPGEYACRLFLQHRQ